MNTNMNHNQNASISFLCVFSQLEVASQKIDMLKSILDGANIQNCGDSNEISVSFCSQQNLCLVSLTGRNAH